jgi:uncharacterized protein
MRLRIATIFLACIVVAAQALALTFPALTGRVVDEAGILDASARDALEKLSADLEAKSSDQLVIVTLKSLQGTSIDDYGYQLGRAWKIGQKGKDNGVLLIVAPNERKVRIEVGYGLEGTLTDAISSVIVQGSILPRFRAGDFPGGVTRGAQDIARVLTGDAEEYRRRAEAAANAAEPMRAEEMVIIAIFVVMAILIVLNMLSQMRRPRGAIPPGRVRRTRDWTDYNPVVIPGGGWSGGRDWGGSSGGFSGGGGSFGGGGSSGSW